MPTSSPASAAPAQAGRGEQRRDPGRRGQAGGVDLGDSCRRCRRRPRPAPAEVDAGEVGRRRARRRDRRRPAGAGRRRRAPSTSDSRTSRSARTRWATSAASRSLSPNRISSVATVSFSLTTGTTPSVEQPVAACAGRCGSARGGRRRRRSAAPGRRVRPCRANASAYGATSRPWPTLAAACWVARSRGRARRPSGASPAAIAPEETSTTWRPAPRRRARRARRPSASRPPGRRARRLGVAGQRRRPDLDDDPRRRPADRARRIVRAAPSRLRRVAAVGLRGDGAPRGRPAARAPARQSGSQSNADVADDDLVARLGARLAQLVLDAEPGQPVGEVADGLVVGEVGLRDPALGLARRARRSRPSSTRHA